MEPNSVSFQGAADYYHRRPSYVPGFFGALAKVAVLPARARVVDLCAGTGDLAAGMSSFAAACQVVDAEEDMLKAARGRRYSATCSVSFVRGRVEDLEPPAVPFDFATIGRALHWLDRETALTALDALLTRDGALAICDAGVLGTPWRQEYVAIRNRYAHRPSPGPMLDGRSFFAGTAWREVETVTVRAVEMLTVEHLVERAFSYSRTSRAALGTRGDAMAAELKAMLSRYADGGLLREPVFNVATVFRRCGG